MNNREKNKIKMLSISFCIIIVLLTSLISLQIHNAKKQLLRDIPIILREAVEINVAQKSKGVYFVSKYIFDPKKNRIDQYETRTARYADTTFTYQRKIVDPTTSAFNGFQTVFLDMGELSPDSIHLIYDSLLQERNIHVESIIGITASFYTKLNEWSSDTTAIDINLRAELTNQGNYEDINYYAYMHYSLYTLWQLIPKTTIYLLFTCSLLIGLFLCMAIHKRNKARKNGITLLKNGNYQIKNIIFDIKEKRLIVDEKEVKTTNQIYELLLLFLSAENHRVSKTDIKKRFWPKTIDPTSNMTSTVNRTNKILKEANSVYTINTDRTNEEFYILSPL